ncbi:MAG: PD-(D/E)XK nuclease family protein [Bacteroidaceae bacterium]|nr:PD-(D/E)XK nuclease family protein [Bacteroidaceae bacterium]
MTNKPFLKAVAEDLYNKVGQDLSRTVVVFPNKRAGLFFNQWLSQSTDKPLWTPAYMTISELFRLLTPLQVADPIRLVCTLYTIFCQETGNDKETLDNFYFWGEMLIADFDDLDKNLVDANRLFKNLEDLHKMIDDHSYLTKEQEEALKLFFHNFSIEKKTELKDRFLTLWNVLGNIYHRFRQTLEADGLTYEGQLYRSVVEGDTDFDALPYDRYVFVGFNVLNQVEHRLFSTLQKNGKALFYWDFDTHYVEPKQEYQQHEAGEFIRRNLRDFPNELTDKNLFDNLSKPKQIEYIAAATENAQARYVPQWLKQHLTEKENETAVVLCNESLLQGVLHTLPEDYVKALNITMGYPMNGTPIHSLLTLLTALYTEGYDVHSGRYLYRYVSAVLKHPYVRQLSFNAEPLERRLTEQNRFYPLPSELQTDDTLLHLFPAEGTSNGASMLDHLLEAIKQCATLFQTTNDAQTAEAQLSQEALFKCYTLVNRLKKLVDEGLLTVSLPILARLINNLLASQSIPFHGEPAIGLQVMGVLETRNLDFSHILMLSVNEGQLPKKEGDSSFIPYNLRKVFGMTTIEHKNSVYAYYFYRLIQRAQNITLIYNTSSDGLNRGEMSRFMLQYLVEKNPSNTLVKYTLQPNQKIRKQTDIMIKGSTEIANRLRKRFGQGKGFLSPSAINVFLDCPLKFYLRYACNLREADEVTTEINSSVFGNIFHRSTEIIYKELLGKHSDGLITKSEIEALLKDDLTLRETVNRAFKEEFFMIPLDQKAEYDGLQLLNKEVITAYVKQLLRRDAAHAPFRFVGAEYTVKKSIQLNTMDGTEPFTINLGGNIDRWDEKNGIQRIIDYKTSNTIQEAKQMEDLFDPKIEHRPYHIFQTFLYASLLTDELPNSTVSPALFYIQKAASEDYSPTVKLAKEPVEDFAPLKSDYMSRLKELLCRMFSSQTDFTQTCQPSHCTFCEFAHMCGRGS